MRNTFLAVSMLLGTALTQQALAWDSQENENNRRHGEIVDIYGQPQGRVNPGGEIVDIYGQPKGRVHAGGEIVDIYGQPKGRVHAGGDIVDVNGQPKGRVR